MERQSEESVLNVKQHIGRATNLGYGLILREHLVYIWLRDLIATCSNVNCPRLGTCTQRIGPAYAVYHEYFPTKFVIRVTEVLVGVFSRFSWGWISGPRSAQSRSTARKVLTPTSTSLMASHFQPSATASIVGVHYRVGQKIGEGSFGVIYEGLFTILHPSDSVPVLTLSSI